MNTNLIVLYIWAHLRAAALVDELNHHGLVATLVRIDIDDQPASRT